MATQAKKHKAYTIETKLSAITELEKGHARSDIAKKYGIDASMLAKWQKNQGIISAFKALYRKHMLRRIHSHMEGKIAEFELSTHSHQYHGI